MTISIVIAAVDCSCGLYPDIAQQPKSSSRSNCQIIARLRDRFSRLRQNK